MARTYFILFWFYKIKKEAQKNAPPPPSNNDKNHEEQKQLDSPLAMFLDLQETSVKFNGHDISQQIFPSSNQVITHYFMAACSQVCVCPARRD